MSIDMYLGDSDRQNQSVSSTIKSRSNHYNDLKRTLAQFHMSSPFLSGVTYDSAKKYSQKILIPLIKAGMLLDEAVKESCESFTKKYREEVDTVDLRESELLDKIDRAETLANQSRNLMSLEFRNEHPNATYLRNLQRIEDNHLETKRLLEEKLAKLRSFNSNSRTVFAKVDEIYQLIQKGINEATHSWSEVGNQFIVNTDRFAKWDHYVNLKWSNSSYHMQELIEKGRFMTEQDIYKLINYLSKYPKAPFFWNGIDAILEYIFYKPSNGIKLEDVLMNITTASSEEFLTKFLSKLDDSAPQLSNFIHAFVSTNNVFSNTSFTFDVNGFTKAIEKGMVNKVGKSFTNGLTFSVSNVANNFGLKKLAEIGKVFDYKLTGVNASFLFLDFLLKLNNEKVGTAFVHTISSAYLINVGVNLVKVGLSFLAEKTVLQTFIGLLNPMALTISVSVGLAFLIEHAYSENWFGFQSSVKYIGEMLTNSVEHFGNALSESLQNLRMVFGW